MESRDDIKVSIVQVAKEHADMFLLQDRMERKQIQDEQQIIKAGSRQK